MGPGKVPGGQPGTHVLLPSSQPFCSPHRVTLARWASREWPASLGPRYGPHSALFLGRGGVKVPSIYPFISSFIH